MSIENTKKIVDSLKKIQDNQADRILTENLYLKKLLEVSCQLGTSDLKGILDAIIETIIDLTGANRGFILLLGDDDSFNFEHHAGTPAAIDDKISLSIAHHVVKTGKYEFIKSISSDGRYKDQKSVVELGLKAVMCMPLKIAEKVIGIIYIDTDLAFRQLSSSGLSLFEAFAAQAAIAIQNARLVDRLKVENVNLKNEVFDHYRFTEIVGDSEPMQDLLKLLTHVLDNAITVLIQGETGTGKELIARGIHYNSLRKDKPFVTQNCAAVAESLLDSELFGYKKGAFTGAHDHKAGLFEQADGGTLFLDEVSETSLTFQSKLLRVLETSTVKRIGEEKDRKVDVRIIAATNRDLKKSVENGDFRADLFYRLNAFPVYLPALRDRTEDIPLLVHHFVKHYNHILGKQVTEVDAELMEELCNNHWEGNVRELRNSIHRLMILAEGFVLTKKIMPMPGQQTQSSPASAGDVDKASLKSLEEVEREHFLKVLAAVDGNKTHAAKILGLKRATFLFRLKKLGL